MGAMNVPPVPGSTKNILQSSGEERLGLLSVVKWHYEKLCSNSARVV